MYTCIVIVVALSAVSLARYVEVFNRGMSDIGSVGCRSPPEIEPKKNGRTYQQQWKCYPKPKSGIYSIGTMCNSQCYTGAMQIEGSNNRIRCFRESWNPHEEPRWDPAPLHCQAIQCDTSEIFPVEHGRWEPEICMVKRLVDYNTKCRLVCDEFYRRETEHIYTHCMENGWTQPKASFSCVLQDGIAAYMPGAEHRPEEDIDIINNPSLQAEYTKEQLEEMQEETGASHIRLRQRVEAAMAEQEERKVNDVNVRKEFALKEEQERREKEAAEKEEHERIVAEIEAKKQAVLDDQLARALASNLHSGETENNHPDPEQIENSQPSLVHSSNGAERVSDNLKRGGEEIVEGIETVVKSSSPTLLIIVSVSIAVTVIGVIITVVYFSRRNRQQYALVNQDGEQLLPLNNNNNQSKRSSLLTDNTNNNSLSAHTRSQGINMAISDLYRGSSTPPAPSHQCVCQHIHCVHRKSHQAYDSPSDTETSESCDSLINYKHRSRPHHHHHKYRRTEYIKLVKPNHHKHRDRSDSRKSHRSKVRCYIR